MFPAQQPMSASASPSTGPGQVGQDLTEIVIRLRSIRTEISTLTAQDHRPAGDQIVHDLDEVIQCAGRAASAGPLADQKPAPESRGAATLEAFRLPSGPDYPAPMYG